jgi:hypothetical protein
MNSTSPISIRKYLLKLTKKIAVLMLIVHTGTVAIPDYAEAFVTRKGDSVFIVDRQGEHWDVAQAASIGFDPHGFQFGIGRHAIKPLDDSRLHDRPTSFFSNPRVIAVTDGTEKRAYSVSKLTRHEIRQQLYRVRPYCGRILTAGGSGGCVQPRN